MKPLVVLGILSWIYFNGSDVALFNFAAGAVSMCAFALAGFPLRRRA